jgi:hypothetical protein
MAPRTSIRIGTTYWFTTSHGAMNGHSGRDQGAGEFGGTASPASLVRHKARLAKARFRGKGGKRGGAEEETDGHRFIRVSAETGDAIKHQLVMVGVHRGIVGSVVRGNWP